MRIGIGITTYNRPECFKKCLEQINKHTPKDDKRYHYLAVEDSDESRMGVAFRKNQCLKAFKDFDHIFLFDDDCYPIRGGWAEFFINNGGNHQLFLIDRLHKRKDNIVFNDCGGVFMYMTKQCIDKVGAFNEKFTPWGFEHAEYSQRIFKAGLTIAPYTCLYGTENYLYAADYSDPNHVSSISNEEKQKYFDLNFPKYKEPIKNIYIPL